MFSAVVSAAPNNLRSDYGVVCVDIEGVFIYFSSGVQRIELIALVFIYFRVIAVSCGHGIRIIDVDRYVTFSICCYFLLRYSWPKVFLVVL